MKTIIINGIGGYLGNKLAYQLSEKFKIIGFHYDLSRIKKLNHSKFPVYESKNGINEQVFHQNKIYCIIDVATVYYSNNVSASQISFLNTAHHLSLVENGIKSGCEFYINIDTNLPKYCNSYSLSKSHFKEWLKLFSDKINVINLKLEHFYGPGASKKNFITQMIFKLLNNSDYIALTEGNQKRDFIFIDDLLDLIEILLNKIEKFNSYNELEVGTGNNITIIDLISYIKKQTKSKSILNFGEIPYRKNEIMESKVDISPLIKLGWYPKVSIEQGIDITINSEIKNRND